VYSVRSKRTIALYSPDRYKTQETQNNEILMSPSYGKVYWNKGHCNHCMLQCAIGCFFVNMPTGDRRRLAQIVVVVVVVVEVVVVVVVALIVFPSSRRFQTHTHTQKHSTLPPSVRCHRYTHHSRKKYWNV